MEQIGSGKSVGIRRIAGALIAGLLGIAVFILLPVRADAAPRIMPGGEIFDAEYYAENNPDVAAQLGTDAQALYQHYRDYGKREGRLPYDPTADLTELLAPHQVTLGEKTFSSTDTEVDLTGMSVKDLDMDAFFAQMPYLQKVYMINCGLTSFEYAALQDAHPEIKLVWQFMLANRYVRTDAVAISTMVADWKTSPHTTDAQTWCLRYCTDLIGLDLGHNYIRDLSFLQYMPNLKVLILVDNCGLSDFSALKYCTKLKYLEIFVNGCRDLSFLDYMPELEDLNISFNPIYNIDHLHGMEHLRRLWIVYSRISTDDYLALKAEYPDVVIVNSGPNSIGSGWRTDSHFYAMRRLFIYNMTNDIYY